MQQKTSYWLFLIITLAFFLGTILGAESNVQKNTNSESTIINPKIDAIKNLHIKGTFVVVLIQGDQPSLQIEGSEEDLANLKITNNAPELKITTETKTDFKFLQKKLKVKLTTPALESLIVEGFSYVMSQNELFSDTFKLASEGASKINLMINTEHLEVDLKGTSNLTLSGFAQNQDLALHGSGSFKAYRLVSSDVNLSVYGSGYAYVDVERSLNIKVYGSGGVVYKGNPVIQSQTYGSGKVRKA